MYKLLKGHTTLDIKTARRLHRIVKEAVFKHKDPKLIEIMIRQQLVFFWIMEFKYCMTNPGEVATFKGCDTGKHSYTAIFNEDNIRHHWILIRGLKNADAVTTVFYDITSSEED